MPRQMKCPVCRVVSSFHCRCAMQDACQECGSVTPVLGVKLCKACSEKLERCTECGQQIGEASSYDSAFEREIQIAENSVAHDPMYESLLSALTKTRDQIRGLDRPSMVEFCRSPKKPATA